MSDKKFKAVLFDLDGTLLNTLEDIADSMNAVLEQAGFPAHSLHSYRYMVGDGMDTLVRRVLPEKNRDEATVRNCLAGMRRQYAAHWADKTVPYPGIAEVLDGLSARKIRLTVLSNKPHDLTKEMVERYFSRWNFDCVYGARPDVAKKPDPAAALEIARELAIAPKDFLYVGDTNTDMWTARAAGMFALGVLWGFRPAEELKAAGAEALIEQPLDLLNCLPLPQA